MIIMLKLSTISLLILVCVGERLFDGSVETNSRPKILSRRKRYLLFPEGTSLQLVYCFTIPVYANVVFATTAALAWMLPTSLEDLRPEKLSKDKNRRIDKGKISPAKNEIKAGYLSSFVKYNKPIKYSYRPQYMQLSQPIRYHTVSFSPSYQKSYNRRQFYRPLLYRDSSYYTERDPITSYINPVHNEVHRRTRRNLFSKIEKFFKAQRKDGRACLLKAVCEVSQVGEGETGTFIQEIIKAIFRVRADYEGRKDIYDIAASIHQNCTEIYPECDFSLWDVF